MEAFLITILVYSFAFLANLLLFLKNDLIKNNVVSLNLVNIMIICGLCHFLGGAAYYEYAVHNGADSISYFNNAHTSFSGAGTSFSSFVVGYLRKYLVGDSYFAAFMFSSALSFCGSVFYFLAYKKLLDRISGGAKYYLLDKRIIQYPALILLCWPSYFFWSAGLGKDSFVFLSLGMLLYCFSSGRFFNSRLLLLSIFILLGLMMRPYLLIILVAAAMIYSLLNLQKSIFFKLKIMIAITIIVLAATPVLINYGGGILSSFGSLTDVASFAIHQENALNTGSSIPLPTDNPKLIFFFLPYLFAGNLLFPLFIGANNLMGMVSSLENIVLLSFIIFFARNKPIWQKIKKMAPISQFFLMYFIVGMSFLGLINTNLGLAMREKMMYVPAFLINIMLVYSYKRILVIQYALNLHSVSIETKEAILT